ncbi:MAG TPA: methyltransferase domain-containing protein [Acidobacteriota bacterium]|nr:methyltransferase domain-containing protein [Acidobacteriota bacterium]
MDARLQRRIQRYGWDKASAYYDRFWERQLTPARLRLLDLAAPGSGERVLDLACGTGAVTFPAAEAAGPDGWVVGTDLSERMIRSVRQEAVKRGLAHVEFKRQDAERIEFPDASFDLVLCSLGLMYVADPLESLREMKRVLKPGGRAVASVWGARKNCGWAEIFPIVDARVESEVCPLFFRLGGGKALHEAFAAAGFGSIQAERLSTILEYDAAEGAIGAAFAGGPVALAYSRFDESTRQSAHAEYLASIERFRSGSGFRIPGEFVICRGSNGGTRPL